VRGWNIAWLAALPAVLTVVGIVVVTQTTDIPGTDLTHDPAGLVGYPQYVGLFSYLGILLWAATASVAIFAFGVLRKTDLDRARYFLFAGLLSAVFAVDDLFMLHEDVLPHRVGIDELIVMSVYGLLGLAFLIRHYARIVVEGAAVLVAAVVSFGITVLVDLWNPLGFGALVEDVFQMLGTGLWLGHFWNAAARSLRPAA
jgi:hypothetical protein